LLCGLWFKESGVLGVVMVVLYDAIAAPDRGPRRMWRMRWRYAAFAPALVLYFALRLRALGGALPGIDTVPLTRFEMVLNAIALLPEYARTLAWPFDLNMYHDFEAIHGLGAPRLWAGAAMLSVALLTAVVALRRHRALAFAILWAIVAAAPHLLVRWPQLNVFAERYLYLPSVGVFLALGYAASRLEPRIATAPRRALAMGAVVLLVVFIAVDARRARDWHDEVTIYGKTLTQSKRAELIRTNLAVRYLELERYDEGIALLEELMRINPEWHETRHNLGLLYMGKGETAKAIASFEEARRRDPFKGATLLNLGYLYDQEGRREEAVEAYLDLVEREPRDAGGWYNLAVVGLETGQLDNADYAVARVLERSAADADAAGLKERIARARAKRAERVSDAAATARRCAAAKDLLDAGDQRAAALALRAASWLDERAALPHQYLANLYYLAGRLPAAREQMQEAVERAPENELYKSNLAAIEKVLRVRDGR
jgi:tetratricopeptide (TPR) repeat protein